MNDTDIDIDFADRNAALDGLRYVIAVEHHGKERHHHHTGVYFQNIPTDPLDGMAVWVYQDAPAEFIKIDFINNTIYPGVRDEAHLVDLLTREPPWELFDDEVVIGNLVHIKRHIHLVRLIKPRSIDDLAVCIALMRPGKKHLINRPRPVIDRNIWLPSEDGYAFKRSHAIAYAGSIVVQLNLMLEQL